MKALLTIVTTFSLLLFFQNCSDVEFEALTKSKLVGVNGGTGDIVDPNSAGPNILDDSLGDGSSENENEEVVDNHQDSEPPILPEDSSDADNGNEDTEVSENNDSDNSDSGGQEPTANNDDSNVVANPEDDAPEIPTDGVEAEASIDGVLVECLLEGPGKSNVVGLLTSKLGESGNRGIKNIACMSSDACEYVKNNTALKVVGPLKSMRCNKSKNKNIKKLSDDEVVTLVGK